MPAIIPELGIGTSGDRAVESLGRVLLRTGSISAIRNMGILPENAQKVVEDTVIESSLQRLTFVKDLLSIPSLRTPLPDWLSIPMLYWNRTGRNGTASRQMNPKVRSERFVNQRDGQAIPIPCTLATFSFTIRDLLAAKRARTPLETSHIATATYNVDWEIENTAIRGWRDEGGNLINVSGFSTPGLMNAPNASTVPISDWSDPTVTGAEIEAEVVALADAARAQGKRGPYYLYVNSNYYGRLNRKWSDGVTTFDKTIKQMLEALEYGGSNLVIKEADQIPDGTVEGEVPSVALIQMTPDVVDVIVGQQPTPLDWSDGPGWETYFAVLACVVVRFRDDIEGKSGVVIGQFEE